MTVQVKKAPKRRIRKWFVQRVCAFAMRHCFTSVKLIVLNGLVQKYPKTFQSLDAKKLAAELAPGFMTMVAKGHIEDADTFGWILRDRGAHVSAAQERAFVRAVCDQCAKLRANDVNVAHYANRALTNLLQRGYKVPEEVLVATAQRAEYEPTRDTLIQPSQTRARGSLIWSRMLLRAKLERMRSAGREVSEKKIKALGGETE